MENAIASYVHTAVYMLIVFLLLHCMHQPLLLRAIRKFDVQMIVLGTVRYCGQPGPRNSSGPPLTSPIDRPVYVGQGDGSLQSYLH